MLISIISQIHGLPSALHTASSEALVGVCELRGKLRHFSTLNKRFAAVISRSSPEDWLVHGKVLGELGAVEEKIDGWVGSIKADEFNWGDCARDLGNLIAHLNHLAQTTYRDPELDIAEQQLGSVYSFDSDLDNFAAAIGFARQAVLRLADEADIEIDVGESSLEQGIYEPVQRILDIVRGIKVQSGRRVAHLEEMVQVSRALLPDSEGALLALADSISDAVDMAVQLAQRIGAHVASIRTTKETLRLADIEQFVLEVTSNLSATTDTRPWDGIAAMISDLNVEFGSALPNIKQASSAGQFVSSGWRRHPVNLTKDVQ